MIFDHSTTLTPSYLCLLIHLLHVTACSNTLQTKKIVTEAKKIQQNQQRVNRQTRQKQQKDARQNIINNRRGMQVTAQANC